MWNREIGWKLKIRAGAINVPFATEEDFQGSYQVQNSGDAQSLLESSLNSEGCRKQVFLNKVCVLTKEEKNTNFIGK